MKLRVEKDIKSSLMGSIVTILFELAVIVAAVSFYALHEKYESYVVWCCIIIVAITVVSMVFIFAHDIPRTLKSKKLHNDLVAEIKEKREIYYACTASLTRGENSFEGDGGILYFTEAGFEWYGLKARSNKNSTVYVPLDKIGSLEMKKMKVPKFTYICLKTDENDVVFVISTLYSGEISELYNEKTLT